MASTPILIEGFDKYSGTMSTDSWAKDPRYTVSGSADTHLSASALPNGALAAPYTGARYLSNVNQEYNNSVRLGFSASSKFYVAMMAAPDPSATISNGITHYGVGLNLGYASDTGSAAPPIRLRIEPAGLRLYYPGGDVYFDISRTADTWDLFELYVEQHATAGEIALWIGGVQYVHLTGVNTGSSAYGNFVWAMRLGSLTYYYAKKLLCLYVADCDSIADVPHRNFYVPTVPVDGDSSLTGFTSGDSYTDVDDVPHDGDTSTLTSTSSTAKALFTLGSLPTLPFTGEIKAVSVASATKRLDGGAVVQQRAVLKSGTTEATSAWGDLDTTIYKGTNHLAAVDPHDSAAWTTDKLNALEIGVEFQPAP